MRLEVCLFTKAPLNRMHIRKVTTDRKEYMSTPLEETPVKQPGNIPRRECSSASSNKVDKGQKQLLNYIADKTIDTNTDKT